MVKLIGNDTMEEIEAYFDYDNNFTQLLEDYLYKSSEIQKQLDKSKSTDKKKFIRNQRAQLKKLYEEGDHDKPRIKLFKTWMSNLYEQKKMRYHKKNSDIEKDNIILELSETIIQLRHEVRSLSNENQHYKRKINKLRKQLKAPKPEPPPEPKPEPLPEPEPPQEPSPELLKMMDPDYDSDDDIVEKPPPPPRPEPPKEEPKIDSIYSNHLTEQEEKEKDEYEQNIKAECERVARQREEDIENKEKIVKILETYYSQCDLKMDVIYKRFNKEVKKADRTKRNIKNDYIDEFEIYLEELREEYVEEHDELSSYFNAMFDKPSRRFEDLLPSEMVKVQSIN